MSERIDLGPFEPQLPNLQVFGLRPLEEVGHVLADGWVEPQPDGTSRLVLELHSGTQLAFAMPRKVNFIATLLLEYRRQQRCITPELIETLENAGRKGAGSVRGARLSGPSCTNGS